MELEVHPGDPPRADSYAPENRFVRHSLRPVPRVRQRVDEDRLLHLRGDTVRVRPLRSRHPVQEPLGPAAFIFSPLSGRRIRRAKLAIRLMYDALLRIGEAAALRWEDVIWPESDDAITGEVYDETPAKIIIRQSKTDQYGESVIRPSAPTRG